jgi:zeta-carotene desaturase
LEARGNGAFHEHSYHMFLNWYHNFWRIASEIGVEDRFQPMTKVKFLHRGEFPEMKELVNFGSRGAIFQNLFSGVLPVTEMFLYMYSVLDLLSTPMEQEGRYRDLISVNAFATTKLYSTERSASLYDEYLAKTFAIASHQSAAKTFKTFIEYGTYCPTPLYWALKGDCYNYFMKPLEEKLEKLGVRMEFRREVTGVKLDSYGNASEISFQEFSKTFNPTLSEMAFEQRQHLCGRQTKKYKLDGPVIVAIPHGALARLLTPELLNRSSQLGETEKLRSVPMASVHLHLNDKFARRIRRMGVTIPAEPVVLVDSKYKLSFVDNSRLWPGLRDSYFNIVASDSRPLNRLEAPTIFTADKESGKRTLNLETPVTTMDHILSEFRRFIHFEHDEIDMELLQIDRNVGRQLFINEVGSWQSRPETRTQVKNLFLAGDYCKNTIDAVCLEGAVVSGLEAADCVRRYCGRGAPIRIERPKKYPYQIFWPLKFALAPYAAGAKLLSVLDDVINAAQGRRGP